MRGNAHSPADGRKGERSELGVATEHGADKWRLWSIDTSVGGWFSPTFARFAWETRRWCCRGEGCARGCHAARHEDLEVSPRPLSRLLGLYSSNVIPLAVAIFVVTSIRS